MKKSINVSIFCLFFLISTSQTALATRPPPPRLQGLPFIKQVCSEAKKSDHHIDMKFCVATLKAIPGAQKATLPDLLEMIAQFAGPHLKAAEESAGRWLKIITDPKTQQALQACGGAFMEGANVLLQTVVATGTGNYLTVLLSLPAAIAGAFNCEEKTRTGPGGPVLIASMKDIQQLLSLSKALIKLIMSQRFA